ncbi:MAG: glycosyltransferase, partial [Candidatus Pacearchaeota archaeon]
MRISTGSIELDRWLGGGYESDIVTTLYGPAGSGKSNLCVMAAAQVARRKKVIFIDADGSILPNEIPKMVKKLDEYDVVVGDRMSRNSVVIADSYRKFIGTVFNLFVSIIFNTRLKDNLCGFKGFKREIGIK